MDKRPKFLRNETRLNDLIVIVKMIVSFLKLIIKSKAITLNNKPNDINITT